MSKTIAGVALATLGGSAVAGTAIMLPKWLNAFDAELPASLTDFKQGAKDEGCVKSLFPTLAQIETTDDTDNVESSFFATGKKTTGCLVVNWDKYTKREGGDKKWYGDFRFLWAVKGETKGFIVFLAGKTPSEAGKQEIQWEGGIYKLEESSADPKRWTAKKQQEIAASQKAFKKDNGSDATTKFPHPGTALKGRNKIDEVPPFWGLMSSAEDLTKITARPSDASSQTSTSYLRAYWSWESSSKGSDSKKLSEWSKDWDKWWKEVFDDAKFKAKDLSEAHQGFWTPRKYVHKPESND